MRNNIDTQPLAAVRGQQLELGRFRPVFSHEESFKRLEDEEQEEEYIDVIGEYPSSEPEPEVLVPKAQSLLEQPPSKIYYDNIEKESSDGGFFDRDDLEDEDERNELVIDCKLLNGGGEPGDPLKKKTDLRISQEPEVVFNFTLVDTQLVYNESKLVQKDNPVISVHIPPPPQNPKHPSSMLQHHLQHSQPQQPRIASQLRNLKEVRTTRPYSRLMPNDPRRMSRSYRSVTNGVPARRPVGLTTGDQMIGSRSRNSAFAPPTKSHFIVRESSVQQLPATNSSSGRRPVHVPSYPPQTVVEKLPKKPSVDPSIPHSSPHQPPRGYVKILPRRDPPPPSERPRTVTYLPVQFGFGSSVLHNLYDDQKPLDFSKDSPLWQYEAMLKGPREQQLRQGYHILNSLPIPKPPKPPQRAIRPKLVPMKRHPTLCQLRRSSAPPPPTAPAPPPPTEPRPKPAESFRTAMQTQIDAFFVQRQKEICAALRNYSDERIDVEQLFAQLEQLEIRYNRDYLGLAGILIKRYGCRFRATFQMDYKWPERPQDFVEYFANLRRQSDLKPRATDATLDIYRMVVGGLLEQFRASMEHFLSSNLEAVGK
ncbi:conserved hypothetical protein [Culex quinquefasciatus]|uniref:Uncharacterized protein n=1 Tax=Culex quinquefasciatus TaxID=7176 RepID=B0W2M7_CULQU|nr:conserved hypothetical protein [Culex quinquefasciatus]|eukprot:XP_001842946.1 conserved hypothetical protein [Culex quinquefasciatus]